MLSVNHETTNFKFCISITETNLYFMQLLRVAREQLPLGVVVAQCFRAADKQARNC